jgi:hypothetical protein
MREEKCKPLTVKYHKASGKYYIKPYGIAGIARQLQLRLLRPVVTKLLFELRTKMAELDDRESEVQEYGDEAE